MRRLIMWNMVTLDGYFEGRKKWQIDWHLFEEEELEYALQMQLSAGTLLFGRVTYEGMAEYWPTAEGAIADFMNSVDKVVCSRTLEQAEWNNSRIVRDAATEVPRLKEEAGGDIFVFGSADLSATLMEHGLFDEYRLGIHPLVLGGGTPLFKTSAGRHDLRLVEARQLKSGLAIHHYRPAGASRPD